MGGVYVRSDGWENIPCVFFVLFGGVRLMSCEAPGAVASIDTRVW